MASYVYEVDISVLRSLRNSTSWQDESNFAISMEAVNKRTSKSEDELPDLKLSFLYNYNSDPFYGQTKNLIVNLGITKYVSSIVETMIGCNEENQIGSDFFYTILGEVPFTDYETSFLIKNYSLPEEYPCDKLLVKITTFRIKSDTAKLDWKKNPYNDELH